MSWSSVDAARGGFIKEGGREGGRGLHQKTYVDMIKECTVLL